MGKPAARVGDMTAHGGAINGPGCPTVFIGGMPAATLGDMHVCPMATPGTPPIPHVGGPVNLGSTGVFIGGKPAARMGDMCICVGPPASIISGCTTVMIGEIGGSGGGAGGGAGGGSGGGGAAAGAITSAAIAGHDPQPDETEDHFLAATFTDKAKLPIGGVRYTIGYPDKTKSGGVLAGAISRMRVPEGNYTVTLYGIVDARWSAGEAEVGSAVDLIIDTVGVENGTKATIAIYVRDMNYTDHLLTSLEATVGGDTARASWTMQVDEKYLKICGMKEAKRKFSSPFFFFRVSIGELREQSGMLDIKDWIELKVHKRDGSPAANEEFVLTLTTGEIKTGRLDANGYKKIEGVTPSSCTVTFPNLPDVFPL